MVVVLPLLLLLLGSSPTARAAAGDDEHAEFTALDMGSLKPSAGCSGHRVTPPQSGSWVPLYRPLGPCSPSFRGAAEARPPPSLADVLRQDRLRVRHIHRMASGDARVSKGSRKEPVTVEETQVHHQAAISIGVGTEWTPSSAEVTRVGPAATDDDGSSGPSPAVSQTVVLDTASDVPWVRCVSCPSPFAECNDYDPTRSSTYAAFPCNSTACKQLGRYAGGCANGQCQYSITVTTSDGGNFTSSGTYSFDQLTINSASPIPGFRFGCSRSEQGSFESQAGGVMALGRGAQSLTAQTSSTFGDAFSYCLPPSETSKGFFRLGGVPSAAAASRLVMTPMLRDRRRGGGDDDATLYRARLVSITVDGRALNVDPDVFAAGTVLDSRTVITRLPLTAYGALRAAFRNRMAHRAAPPQGELDTCYDLRGVRYPRVPRVALVFDGDNAVVELDRSGVLFDSCLAFAPNDDDASPSVLGNVQLQTIEVLHDVGGRRIGFRRDAC